MSDLIGDFDGKIDFDIFHFTNSPNASPLIVRSSYDSNKIYNHQFEGIFMTFPFFLHYSPYRNLFHRSYCLFEYRTL
jgi:hypothetical protein